jgi:hypothetical protein
LIIQTSQSNLKAQFNKIRESVSAQDANEARDAISNPEEPMKK